MIRKVIIFMITMSILMVSASALTVDVSYDPATREVILSGTAAADSIITMRITSGLEEGGLVTPENAKDVVFASFQTKASPDGTYEESFTLDSKASDGWYNAKVYSSNDMSSAEYTFFMADALVNQEMLDEFNQAEMAQLQELCRKYSEDIPILKVDMEDYLYPEEIANFVLEEREKLTGGFTNGTQVEKIVNAAIGTANLKYCQETEVGGYIAKYAEAMGITLDANYEAIKEKVEKHFVQQRLARPQEEIKDLFMEAMALCVLNNAVRSEIESVVRTYHDIFKLDLEGFEKYDSIEISKALYGNNYTDIESVKADYDKRIGQLEEESKPSGGNGGSGGSGGGSSGGGSGGGKKTGSNISVGAPSIEVDAGSYTEGVEEVQLPFQDLEGFEWAKSSIKQLFAAGVISGETKECFNPAAPIKRSEICKMICSALGTEVIIGENPFRDVDDHAWYREYVINAYENNIIVGDGELFMPEDPILRRDMALMVARALENRGFAAIPGNTFLDITAADEYAAEAISTLAGYGIIDGKGDQIFAPADYVTRAEAAKILCNMMEVLSNE